MKERLLCNMKKVRKKYDCMEYLSVVAPLDKVEKLEDKQSRYIREYVANKEYCIVGTVRRNGFSMNDVNRQWTEMVKLIKSKRLDGIIVANMAAVASNLPEAYRKVGEVVAAGGIVVTVDEGRLELNIRREF